MLSKTMIEEQVEAAISGDGGGKRQLGVFMFYVLARFQPHEREQLWVKTSTGIWCSYIRLFAVAFDSIQGPTAA